MHRPLMRAALFGLCAAGSLLCAGNSAQAIIIKKATVQEITDPTFLYKFDVDLEAGCTLKAGDFFTIYDMINVGNVPPDMLHTGSSNSQPPLWSFSVASQGPTPLGVTLPVGLDSNPNLLNVFWTYNGPDITTPMTLGIFTVTIVQPVALLDTLYYSFQCGGIGPGSETGLRTFQAQLVPEPSSMISLACGIAALGVAGLRRFRRPRLTA